MFFYLGSRGNDKTPIFVQQQVGEIWRELKQTSSENLSSAVIDTIQGRVKAGMKRKSSLLSFWAQAASPKKFRVSDSPSSSRLEAQIEYCMSTKNADPIPDMLILKLNITGMKETYKRLNDR